MRTTLILAVAATALAPSAASAFSTPVAAKSGPAIVPYLCSGGAIAELIYENGAGNRHALAKLSFDGHKWDMHEAPSYSGLRYTAADGDHQMAWSVKGEDAWISRASGTGFDAPEQEVARCIRLRGGRPAAHAEGHEKASGH